jgi:hypothetical protein
MHGLVSGCLFQTVWNVLTGRAPDHGIRDYDLFYFDSRDISWEAEDTAIRQTASVFDGLEARIELRNQARVHLWYPEKFRVPYPQLGRATDGIDRFLLYAAQVGIRPEGTGFGIYAPNGFNDIISMVVRPNTAAANFRADLYRAKAARWKLHWPEITVVLP